MKIARYEKNGSFISLPEWVKGKSFIAIFGSSRSEHDDELSFSYKNRSQYLNPEPEYVSIDYNEENLPRLDSDRVSSNLINISSLRQGDFAELSYAYAPRSDREYLYVIENSDSHLLVASFESQKKMEKFAREAREAALSANEATKLGNKIDNIISAKEIKIRATFSSLKSSPADYQADFHGIIDNGSLNKKCDLCDTPIRYQFPILHAADPQKNLMVGSECVYHQALASADISEIEKAEIMHRWISSAGKKSDLKSDKYFETHNAPSHEKINNVLASEARIMPLVRSNREWVKCFLTFRKKKDKRISSPDSPIPKDLKEAIETHYPEEAKSFFVSLGLSTPSEEEVDLGGIATPLSSCDRNITKISGGRLCGQTTNDDALCKHWVINGVCPVHGAIK